ncbi:MAG: AraC family transcriptional regulator [Xanthobacteraceae bacterium]|nr:AraC family transcriptional regulator [Xanthobacteraceae bacterium]
MKVWSTDEVSSRQTLSYWKDAVCDAFLRVQTEYREHGKFRGRIASTPVGGLVANDVVSQGHLVRRSRSTIARDSDAWFFVNLHKAGACSLTQDGQCHTPEVGDFSVHDGTRPFDLNFHDDMALTCFVVPRAILLARTTEAHHAVARPLPRTGAGALFRSYATALAAAAPRLSPVASVQAGDIFLDLLSLAIGANAAGAEAARPAARFVLFQQVCARIRSSLSDPLLSLDRAAAKVGMSSRTLQTLFHANGTSFTAYVIEQRLQLADRLLSSGPGTVTEVAYATGFSDLSHFSRSFRRRFGISARERRMGSSERDADTRG